MKPHKHAALIKAWADGAEIQFRAPKPNFVGGWYEWVDFKKGHAFFDDYEYRIKPEPKPDLWQATFVCSPRLSGFKP